MEREDQLLDVREELEELVSAGRGLQSRHVILHHVARVQDGHEYLGQEPRELRHTHVLPGPLLGRDLGRVLEEARLPHGLAHAHDDEVGEERDRVRADGQEERRCRHHECSPDHHVVDLLLLRQCRDDRHEDEDQDRIQVGGEFELVPDPPLVRPADVLWKHEPVVREQGLHRDQGEDEEGELAVRERVHGEPTARLLEPERAGPGHDDDQADRPVPRLGHTPQDETHGARDDEPHVHGRVGIRGRGHDIGRRAHFRLLLASLGPFFGLDAGGLFLGDADGIVHRASPQDEEGRHQGHASQGRVHPERARDAEVQMLFIAQQERVSGQVAAQVHERIEHGEAHGLGLRGRELPHRGVGRGLVHAIAHDDDQDAPHGREVERGPQAARLHAEHGRSRGHQCPPHDHEHKRDQEREAHTLLVGHSSEEEHGERDARGQHRDHVVGPHVGLGDAQKDGVREVDGQVPEKAEVHQALEEVPDVDAPQRTRRLHHVDERLQELLEQGLLHALRFRLLDSFRRLHLLFEDVVVKNSLRALLDGPAGFQLAHGLIERAHTEPSSEVEATDDVDLGQTLCPLPGEDPEDPVLHVPDRMQVQHRDGHEQDEEKPDQREVMPQHGTPAHFPPHPYRRGTRTVYALARAITRPRMADLYRNSHVAAPNSHVMK